MIRPKNGHVQGLPAERETALSDDDEM